MANLRGPFPPRWALTAGLLTTESLDHSSTVSTARLAFRRPRHCSFFLFAPVQECARSSCFTLLRISFLSTEISSRGGDAWKEERWTEIGVCEYGENFRILWIDKWIKVNRCLWFFFYCILLLLLWVRFKQVFFYFDWTCNFGKYFYEGENLSLYCKQIYEILLLLIYWFFSDFFKTFVGLLDFLDFCKRVMILERFVIILMSFKSFHNSWFY